MLIVGTKGKRFHTAKGQYHEPNIKLGFIIVNNPMDLLCIDFTKMNPSKNSKENILIMTNALS